MVSDASDTRERILQACWIVLEEEASALVRMSDIAKRAGISRQAIYLHFKTRTDLLVATTEYIDRVKDVAGRLEPSRNAATGVARLDAYIKAWGNYIPEIFPIAQAMLPALEQDEAAKHAWGLRMQAMREGCESAVKHIKKDGMLARGLTLKRATDILWTLLSVHNWAQLTKDCGWSQSEYLRYMRRTAHAAILTVGEGAS